jgi:hypothetical protein
VVKLSVTENNQAFWKKFLNLLWIVSAIKLKCFTYFLLNSHTKVNRLSTVLLNDRIARISAVLIKLHLNYSTLPLLISNSQHALFFLLISSYIQQIGLTFCAVSQVQLSSQMDICYTEPNLDACMKHYMVSRYSWTSGLLLLGLPQWPWKHARQPCTLKSHLFHWYQWFSNCPTRPEGAESYNRKWRCERSTRSSEKFLGVFKTFWSFWN